MSSSSSNDWMQDEADFEAMFAETETDRPFFGPGDEVVGKVLHVGEKFVQLDLGSGVDGLLDVGFLSGDKPEIGQEIKGYVVKYRNRTVEVATGMPRGKVDLSALYTALESGMPVEGKVTETNKGGYVVELNGDVRGFCPLGQMDIRRIEDPNELVGSKLVFKVLEMREGRDPVLSRKAVLLAERAAQAEETRKSLVVGATMKGRITRVTDFGAFVDLGGLEGLVHVSEMGYGRRRANELVKPDQTVEVEVLRIEPAQGERRERIGLSMRSLTVDPFDTAMDDLSSGVICRGVVTRIQPYGAFVELANGIEGLLHVSAFGKRVGSPKDMCAVDDKILVRIKSLDPALRRIALAWVEEEKLSEILDPTLVIPKTSLNVDIVGMSVALGDEGGRGEASDGAREAKKLAPPPKVGTILNVSIDRHARFGVFCSWPDGEGLVPFAELGVPHGTDL
ncbi:MAG: S1 RNA-binding domain-containing protein, partial [Myxococcales bacterium]|nr:S1 RNA-binding domain-containing protein [Myxococcales bacterium]